SLGAGAGDMQKRIVLGLGLMAGVAMLGACSDVSDPVAISVDRAPATAPLCKNGEVKCGRATGACTYAFAGYMHLDGGGFCKTTLILPGEPPKGKIVCYGTCIGEWNVTALSSGIGYPNGGIKWERCPENTCSGPTQVLVSSATGCGSVPAVN